MTVRFPPPPRRPHDYRVKSRSRFPSANAPAYTSKHGGSARRLGCCSQLFEVPCLYGQTSGVSQTDNLQLALQRGHRAQTHYLNTTLRQTASGVPAETCKNTLPLLIFICAQKCTDSDYKFLLIIIHFKWKDICFILHFVLYPSFLWKAPVCV